MLNSPKFSSDQRLQAAAQNMPPLKSPERGAAVVKLQEALASLGYRFPQSCLGGKFDGVYGQETTQRVAEFQRAQGLMMDGAAGTQTLEKLDALLTNAPAGGQGQQPGPNQGVWGQPVGGPGQGLWGQPLGRPGSGAWGQRVGGPGSGAGSGAATGSGGANTANLVRISSILLCPHGARLVGRPIPGTDLLCAAYGVTFGETCPRKADPNYAEVSCYDPQLFAGSQMVNGLPTVNRASVGMVINWYSDYVGNIRFIG